MITASHSIRSLIARVSDIVHLHCEACSTVAQWNLGYCSMCTRRGKTVGTKAWRKVEDARISGGWAEGSGDKMRIERYKEKRNKVISLEDRGKEGNVDKER